MEDNKELIENINRIAMRMRRTALELAYHARNNGAHIGGGLSTIEILATLYGGVMRHLSSNPNWDERDRFILSKGHGTLGYYTALCESGYFSREELFTFEENDGIFSGQPSMNMEKGIEISSGSLGMGLPIAVGMALAAKRKAQKHRVFVLLGDGECNEGSIWEAAMSAYHFHLDNLVAIIDYNGMQSDGFCDDLMKMSNMEAAWKGFGWNVQQGDGHNVEELYAQLSNIPLQGVPHVLLAKTVKGKGVSFIENNREWHHGRLTKQQLEMALAELTGENRDA
ncbi:transketolase, beta subunit [Desulfitobacterium dichloroeliminans LMG P-21439]|uniref:Transketolase, beta subunit n=1 Tax=Desulfitobacterium dichloroeliminans (strain LMG P-21439 / DCA1) TaxID=871963 RepID=L0FD74_DESDL|nr:transketolase [Desulfitobacterium dichloroeliminans]AGA70586.1 transketolase, beta subunit [Desulfitobacterium dichloroeliminans LMG P-21439]